MATGKRYYWMKLKESFMTSDIIDYFMEQPDGANYVVLYQMLCLKTINTEGRLSRQIGEIIIPYDVEKIRRDCKWFSADTIRVALKLYQAVGLVYEDIDGTLVLTDHKNLVGSETDYAVQKKMQRDRTKQLPGSGVDSSVDIVHTTVQENVHTDIRDKILDILSGGDDDARAEETVAAFVQNRGKDAGIYFGMTPEIKGAVELLTRAIFKRFASRQPTDDDFASAFLHLYHSEMDKASGEWTMTLPQESQQLLMYAFEQASAAGKPADWRYINGILSKLKERGITTLEQAEDYDAGRNGW